MGTPSEPEAPGHGAALLERIARAFSEDSSAASAAHDYAGELFGNYRLIERIARGGMGDVYRAERADGAYQAQVAVKLLRASIDTEALTARFRREREILARLKHPNIARLLGGGSGPGGIPFLVMEWVDGVALTEYLQHRQPDLPGRIVLFATVCEAVAYAHRNLVLHRDLKPGNVLVDREGQVKLVDFGIGKLLGEDDDADSALTRQGAVPMTPAYASPEQLLGESVTTASDVYSLGVMLYEVLTGQRPFARDTDTPAGLAEAVRTEILTRPSQALARAAAADSAMRRQARRLQGDLDTIVAVALRCEPDRRYPSVDALLQDLRAWHDGLPIRARADALGYRVGKFLARHRVGVAFGLVLAVTLVGSAVVSLQQATEARHQAEQALLSQQFVVSLLTEAHQQSSDAGIDYRVVDLLRASRDRVEQELTDVPALQAQLRVQIAQALLDLGAAEDAYELVAAGVEQMRSIFGPGSQNLATALYALARVESQLDRADAAERAASEAVAILDRLEPTPSLLRTRLLGIEARSANLRGRHELAYRLYHRALLERQQLGDDTPAGLASAWNNLGATAVQADLYRDAEAAYREAMKLLTAHAGLDHPRMAFLRIGLANALIGQGRLDEASAELDAGEAIMLARLDPGSPLFGNAAGTRAQLLGLRERHEEAAAVLAEYLSEDRRRGTDPAGDRRLRLRLALSLLVLERPDAALVELQRVMDAPGLTAPVRGLAAAAALNARSRNGERETLEARMQAVLDDLRAAAPERRSELAEALLLQADLLRRLDQESAASLVAEEAMDLLQSVFGAEHPRVLRERARWQNSVKP